MTSEEVEKIVAAINRIAEHERFCREYLERQEQRATEADKRITIREERFMKIRERELKNNEELVMLSNQLTWRPWWRKILGMAPKCLR